MRRPERAAEHYGRVRFFSAAPLGRRCFPYDPGAARSALAPGYLLHAPSALEHRASTETSNTQPDRPMIQGLRAPRLPLATLCTRLRRVPSLPTARAFSAGA